MCKKHILLLGLVTAIVIPLLGLTSCAVSGLTDEASVQKMPDPVRGMLLDLMRAEKPMLDRCSEGSAKLAQATATIAEGCGLEKDSQKLRAYANSLGKTSSAEDKRKFVIKGSSLISDVNKKIASATNASIKSKEKFKQGYEEKIIAEKTLDQVAMREIPSALLKAGKVAYYCKQNKDALKSNPMAGLQMGMALNYSLVPITFVANDYKKFNAEREAFDEQCQQIGKKYQIKLPASSKPAPISIPKGII